jgi:hypothetical protein
MKDDIESMQEALEKVTAAGDSPGGDLDSEVASLRETWLAFGQMLEAVPSPAIVSSFPTGLRSATGEGVGVGGAGVRANRRLLAAAVLLATSLLIAVATAWTLRNSQQEGDLVAVPGNAVAVNKGAGVPGQAHGRKSAAADGPQWDDSQLDEQFDQVGWQMLCIRQNQLFRTDAFGVVEYQLQQFGRAIQGDAL